MQDVLLPHVYRYLIFRSKNSLQRAICALADETQSEKLARWTRRMYFHAHYEVDLPWSDAAIIIKYAQSLAELQITSILPPVGLMAIGSASLHQLKLYLSQDALLAVMPYIGTRFPNLRCLELAVDPGPRVIVALPQASVSSPMNEPEACVIPHVETLRLGLAWSESSAPLWSYLSKCRFPRLRRLVMRAGAPDILYVPALDKFLDAQRELDSCYVIANGAILSLVLPNLSCRVLTLVPHIGSLRFTRTRELLHPRVQVFRVIGSPETVLLFLVLMDSLSSELSFGTDLVCVRLKQWITFDDLFRWDGTYPDLPYGKGAVMSRMLGYASRLRERGVLLLDCDAKSEDGESHTLYDFEDNGDF
jgi:hypothetical protein